MSRKEIVRLESLKVGSIIYYHPHGYATVVNVSNFNELWLRFADKTEVVIHLMSWINMYKISEVTLIVL